MAKIVQLEGQEIDRATAAALVTDTLVSGAATSEWWQRQSRDLLEKFMDEIRTVVMNGETVPQAITRIVGGIVDGVPVPGIMAVSRREAGALVSTALNAVTTTARLRTFQENTDVIKALQQVSTLDNRTTDVCIAYSGQTWDVETLEPIEPSTLPFNGGTPRHFRCRSTIVPVVKSLRELGFDIDDLPVGTRASMDGQVAGDITFDQWLTTKSASFQDELLGPTKARLWREKKISLTDLVDMRGRPLTVSQLEEKIARRQK